MLWCLAPMDGITDTAYRQIVKEIFDKYNKNSNKKLLMFTEFVSSDGFVHNFDGIKDHLIFEKKEKPLICQIYGGNLQKLVYTAKEIEKNYNFDGIELNIGCPSPKIMRLGGGSALMINKKTTLEYIRTLSKETTLPFSIKTRAGLNEQDKQAQKEFIIQSSNYCWLISIHGRTFKQEHHGEADLDFVLDVKKKANPNCKIVFNGGINREKLTNQEFMKKISKLDGIMIGQAAIGDPWILAEYTPSWEEKKQTIKKHLKLNIKYKGERRGVIEFRKFVGNYIKGIENASKYRLELMKVDNFQDFVNILDKI